MNGVTDQLRHPGPEDHPNLVAAVRTWWGDSRTPEQAQALSLLLPRLFLEHFAGTSLLAEEDGRLHGFLVGFHSQDHAAQAYIHFVGIDPEFRGRGLARRLYETFFAAARAAGRTEVHAITSPANTNSIAFHTKLGFEVSAPQPDYDGPGEDRVHLRRVLA